MSVRARGCERVVRRHDGDGDGDGDGDAQSGVARRHKSEFVTVRAGQLPPSAPTIAGPRRPRGPAPAGHGAAPASDGA